jgi:L-threonylcarbamoyladenylate synthase
MKHKSRRWRHGVRSASTMNEVVRAAGLLRAGELVAFPTETVYGLGADARNPQAIAKIFAAKGRPADHPLIVHLPGASHLERWAIAIPPVARDLAIAFWPGPLTLILRRHPAVPDAVTGGQDTVGLRVPNHPLALQLLREFDGGVAAPSANRFGRISPTTADHVRDELGAAVSMVLDGGACDVGIESTILDLSGDRARILRPGMLDVAAIAAVLGYSPAQGGERNSPRVSGSLEAHYAPATELRLVTAADFGEALRGALDAGRRVSALVDPQLLAAHPEIPRFPASADPVRFAHDLYAGLRELDALGGDLILVVAPPGEEAWRAVHDRLSRAAAGSK